jgi:hypothetical protein
MCATFDVGSGATPTPSECPTPGGGGGMTSAFYGGASFSIFFLFLDFWINRTDEGVIVVCRCWAGWPNWAKFRQFWEWLLRLVFSKLQK